ncbi:MAG: hypothetical protein JWR50_3246 [Mucilaginibacter sp.]|nr:hypothetical protein [Mucilaginibacter sp.]
MKRFLTTSFFLLLTTMLKAQQAYVFKIKYLPNHAYLSTLNTKDINFRKDSLPTIFSETSVLIVKTGSFF